MRAWLWRCRRTKASSVRGGLALANAEQLEAVRAFRHPMTFSGPVQPPMLGAIVASARVHLSEGLAARQSSLQARIALFNVGATAPDLPLACPDETPMRSIRTGDIDHLLSALVEV